MTRRVRAFWAGANPAQKVTLIAGTMMFVAVLQLDATSARVPPAKFRCTNPNLGHVVAIAGRDTDTPKELAHAYCTGDLRAATEALTEETRYTTDTIFHGAVIRLPNSK